MLGKAHGYVSAVLREAEGFGGNAADTVYIGGGTPTALPEEELCRLISGLKGIFDLSKAEEFTVEMNPGTANERYLRNLRSLGVNRISLGAQSFNEKILKTLGRIHTPTQTVQAVEMCKNAGFENISLDLMFSLPGQSVTDFTDSLQKAAALGITHISAYGLKVEEGTPFYENGVTPADEETDRAMYKAAAEYLKTAGFEQYEISNFAKAGYKSKHNLKYWHCEEYFGLGAGAHGYLSLGGVPERTENEHSVDGYIEKINRSGTGTVNKTVLTDEDMKTEKIIMGLRLTEGIEESLLPVSKTEWLIKGGFMERCGSRIRLTARGFDVSNAVLTELI